MFKVQTNAWKRKENKNIRIEFVTSRPS